MARPRNGVRVLWLSALAVAVATGAQSEAEQSCLAGSTCGSSGEDSSLLQARLKVAEASASGDAEDLLPFGFTVMGPGRQVVARLIVPSDEECPTTLMVGRKAVDVITRAEPHAGPGYFVVDSTRTYTKDIEAGFNYSVNNPAGPFGYGDRVCEARFSALECQGIAHAVFKMPEGRPLVTVPLPPTNPTKYVVVGDTGFRVKPSNDGWCDSKLKDPKDLYDTKTCENGTLRDYDASKVYGLFQRVPGDIDPAKNGWPLKKVARQAAASIRPGERPMVVHVGDYTYAHAACPMPFPKVLRNDTGFNQRVMGDCSRVGNAWGDHSENWYFEVFRPMRSLFRASPWIVLRGNHEICNRAGQGFFRYLDPRPLEVFRNASKDAPFCDTSTETYHVDFDRDRWIIMDTVEINETESIDNSPPLYQTPEYAAEAAGTDIASMDTCGNETEMPANRSSDAFVKRFEMAQRLSAPRGKRNWLGVHFPVFGLSYRYNSYYDKPGKYIANPTQLFAFTCQLNDAMHKAKVSIPNMPAVVSGHYHTWQIVEFEGDRPAQLVVGNSGTQLATPRDGQTAGVNNTKDRSFLGERVGYTTQIGEFGYSELLVSDHVREPVVMRSTFMHDRTFRGHGTIRRLMPLRTLSIPKTWLQQYREGGSM